MPFPASCRCPNRCTVSVRQPLGVDSVNGQVVGPSQPLVRGVGVGVGVAVGMGVGYAGRAWAWTDSGMGCVRVASCSEANAPLPSLLAYSRPPTPPAALSSSQAYGRAFKRGTLVKSWAEKKVIFTLILRSSDRFGLKLWLIPFSFKYVTPTTPRPVASRSCVDLLSGPSISRDTQPC